MLLRKILTRDEATPKLKDLSLDAKLALALVAFERFWHKHGFASDHVQAFQDHLWQWPLLDSTSFDSWYYDNVPALIDTLLAGEPPLASFEEQLKRSTLDEEMVYQMMTRIAEIVYDTIFTVENPEWTQSALDAVLVTCNQMGIKSPSLEPFRDFGKGRTRVSPDKVSALRALGLREA